MQTPEAEQIQAVIINQDILEAISDLSLIVNDETLGVQISPLAMYCQKTGHIIGNRAENSLFSLAKIHGKNAIISALYNSVSLNVSPAWLWTGDDAKGDAHLDNLMKQDPIGYAVYCFGLVTAQFYQTQKNTDRKRQPWIEKYWAMARANALLTSRGTAELDELNIQLCRLLTYNQDTLPYLFKRIREFGRTPDHLAMLHCTGELIEILKETINKALDSLGRADAYIKRTKFVDYALTPEDAARGPSNIRRQKASKTSVKEATAFAAMAELFAEAGLDIKMVQMANTPGTGAWKARIAEKQEQKDAEMLQDIENLAGTNWDLGLLEENEADDDNEVEVRTLAVIYDELTITPMQTVEIITPVAVTKIESKEQLEKVLDDAMKPKLTGLALLRAKRSL